DKEIKGLPEAEVDKDTAQNNLTSILGEEYAYDRIEYEGETNGDFVTYDFSIYVGDNVITAQVAKRGGFLINLSGFVTESETTTYSIDECIANAISFANVAGASDMQSVWKDEQKGIAFINLAPVINNVIYYPDLIKVKVDMNSGLVVGYDAQPYAYNHIDRTKTTPTLSAVQARDLLDLTLNINTQKLCIIPLEYGGEVLAYEFNCEYYGDEYYVYINAFNGNEEKVMKVVSTTDEGALTK
ncbi:MAG: PepSY1/2 domain-containing protein, partial [Christensenellales bacterium]